MLNEEFPQFSADIAGALKRWALAEPIQIKLLEDLKAAGLTVK